MLSSSLPPFDLQQSLDPRVISLDRTSGLITTGALSLGSLPVIALVSATTPMPPLMIWALAIAWSVATAGLTWLSYQWPGIAYRHTAYSVGTDGFEIRRGVFWRAVINVPRSRVQHTDVSQGPLERRFGLGALVLYTAGTDHARIDLGGLAYETALALRDHLLPHERDDAV
jgi:membrane protein YdbS with pleckstrin-like domain